MYERALTLDYLHNGAAYQEGERQLGQQVLVQTSSPTLDIKHRIEYRHFYIQLDQRGETVYGFSKIHRRGVEIDFFDFGVGTHHELLAPEKNREHSTGVS